MAVIHWNRPAEADRPSCGHGRSLKDLAGPEASERHAEAIASAERAIKLATALGLPAPARALELRGSARFALGDAGGLDDTRRALEAALAQGLGRETALLYNNLAEDLGRAQGPRAQLELARQGAAFTQRREIAEWMQPLARRSELSRAGPVEWVEQAVKKARGVRRTAMANHAPGTCGSGPGRCRGCARCRHAAHGTRTSTQRPAHPGAHAKPSRHRARHHRGGRAGPGRTVRRRADTGTSPRPACAGHCPRPTGRALRGGGAVRRR